MAYLNSSTEEKNPNLKQHLVGFNEKGEEIKIPISSAKDLFQNTTTGITNNFVLSETAVADGTFTSNSLEFDSVTTLKFNNKSKSGLSLLDYYQYIKENKKTLVFKVQEVGFEINAIFKISEITFNEDDTTDISLSLYKSLKRGSFSLGSIYTFTTDVEIDRFSDEEEFFVKEVIKLDLGSVDGVDLEVKTVVENEGDDPVKVQQLKNNSRNGYIVRSKTNLDSLITASTSGRYVIDSDIDLNEETTTLPSGSELQKTGGKFSNGTIVGNNTKISDTKEQFFGDNVNLSGTWDLDVVRPEWFGANFDAEIRFVSIDGFVSWRKADGITIATDNTIPLQKAFDFAALNEKKYTTVKLPTGSGVTGTVYIDSGLTIKGHGAIENFGKAGTRLIQKSATREGNDTGDDIFRFNGVVDAANGRDFWFGKISDIAFLGDEKNTTGWALNFHNELGQPVSCQDMTVLDHFHIRNFPSGGIWFADGALPLFTSNMKIVFNNGPGILFEVDGPWHHQSCNFTNISVDGNRGGGIKLKGLDRGGHVSIINLKSEERTNSWYKTEVSEGVFEDTLMQSTPLVFEDCAFTPIDIKGATHICSAYSDNPIVGETDAEGNQLYYKKKPGDLIEIIGSKPNISWSAVSIRVRDDRGEFEDNPLEADPVIIKGLDIPYRYSNGEYRNGIYTAHANDVITNAPFHSSLTDWDEQPLRLGNYYIWIDSNQHIRIKNGAPTSALDGKEISSDSHSYGDGSFNSLASVVNVNGKHKNKQVWNETQNRPVYAVGSAPSDVWVYSDGTTAHTPT